MTDSDSNTLSPQASSPDAPSRGDGELLESFIARSDEHAFAVLVDRHGPMVLGVCRRILGNSADADDAFQATFLVLVRKAQSVRPRNLVGNWLHGVARKTALQARAMRSMRIHKEQQAAARERPTMPTQNTSDLISVFDQELNALPAIYRTVIVLCELEGRSTNEAARELACPIGTICARLARGRELLGQRLVRQGVLLGSGAIAAALSQNAMAAAVPPALMSSTLKAAAAVATGKVATAAVSASVATLAESVARGLVVAKLSGAVMIVSAGAVALVAAGGLVMFLTSAPDSPVPGRQAKIERSADSTAALASDPEPDNGDRQVATNSESKPGHEHKSNPDPETQSEPESPPEKASLFDGPWRVVESHINGQVVTAANAKDVRDTRFVFEGAGLIISGTPGISRPRQKRCSYDSTRPAGEMDMTSLDGKEQGQTVACLYKLDQERLTICIPGDPAADRPADFTTRPGDGRVVFVLERVEP